MYEFRNRKERVFAFLFMVTLFYFSKRIKNEGIGYW